MTALDVYLHRSRVGRLERLDGAQLEFAYVPAWVAEGEPLSLCLPLREEPFSDRECRPFFAGLIPEGQFLKAVARALGVSAGNPFSVLEEIGGECAGAVSLVPQETEPPFDRSPPPHWLDETELSQLLKDLPMRPLLIGSDGEEEVLRLSLAGAQNKLPLLADNARLGITRGRPPSSHIVKKPDLGLPELVVNEAYCLALARESGLDAAHAKPIEADGQEGLLVERYDRERCDNEAEVRRIHQEDFCQALGFMPEQKYEGETGPGAAECAALLRAHAVVPGRDLLAFLDALLFNLLIRNSDAHSKNYSLLLDGSDAPRLAPLYDLLSASVYGGGYGRKMAMKYGGEYRPRYVRGRHLDQMAGDLEVSARLVRSHAADLAERVVSARAGARAQLPGYWQDRPLLDEIDATVADAADALNKAAAEPA
ncbi:MAG TPA: type II toxin-antitoxin system HipA family toxin [Solirubrobacterales bacterium]|nr:type II toxin-antitoxin system HipA family toxin [Solirubrobacterales bacterium]